MRRVSAVFVAATAAVLGALGPANAEAARPAAAVPPGRPLTMAEVRARAAAAPAETVWYRIQNRNSHLYLTVGDPTSANGSPIVQRGYQGGNQAQAWTLNAGTTAGYSYLNSATTSSWKALGISASQKTNGAKAIQWTWTPGLRDQQWHEGPNFFGPYDHQLVNLNSGKCLGIPASSKDAEVQAIQWDCKEGLADQYWEFWSWQ